jgi:hypothetical protein
MFSLRVSFTPQPSSLHDATLTLLQAFNLIEIFGLIMPLEWWLSEKSYSRLNDHIMGVIYSPLLLVTAALETRAAHRVKSNIRRGAEDDDVIEEWEQLERDIDFESDGWAKKVDATKPNVEMDTATKEILELKGQIEELRDLVETLVERKVNGGKGKKKDDN